MPDHKDRSAALIAFGTLLILIGALLALVVPMSFLPVLMDQPSASLKTSIASAMLYVALAGAFVWLGIGSIQAKRWARTLTLLLAWAWLIGGVLGAVTLVFVLPAVVKWIVLQGGIAGNARTAYQAMIATVSAVFGALFIALPGIIILFYRSENVRATVAARDPRLSWTERRPEPVVVLSLSHAVMAYLLVFNGLMYHWTVPLFGAIASGWTGALFVLASAGVCVYLTLALYAQRSSAWWGALGFAAVLTASPVITFLKVSPMEYYQAMDLPRETLELLAVMDAMLGQVPLASMVVVGGAYAAYLVYAKKFYER
jgi:hypothetical protein